jgi:HSP20 family protein
MMMVPVLSSRWARHLHRILIQPELQSKGRQKQQSGGPQKRRVLYGRKTNGDYTARRASSRAEQKLGRTVQHDAAPRKEMDRMFEDFGVGRRWGISPQSTTVGMPAVWTPEIEVFQKGDQLTIRTDLPGLKKDEVSVDIAERGITIHGERKREHEEEREGIYRSERSYGSFYRTIPLPEGAITEQAKAQFRDGVLEITLPTPPATKGRRLEITDGAKK